MKKRDILCLMLVLSGLILSCNLMSAIQGNPELKTIKQTEVAINVQQTLMAAIPETIELPNLEQVPPAQNELPTQEQVQNGQPQTPPTQEISMPKESFPANAVEEKGMKMGVLAIEDPAKLSGAYTPTSGMHLVAVQLLIENTGYKNNIDQTDTFNFLPNSSLMLYAQKYEVPCNVVYEAAQELHSEQMGAFALQSGGQKKGWVLFEVPDNDKPISISLINELDAPMLTVKL